MYFIPYEQFYKPVLICIKYVVKYFCQIVILQNERTLKYYCKTTKPDTFQVLPISII